MRKKWNSSHKRKKIKKNLKKTRNKTKRKLFSKKTKKKKKSKKRILVRKNKKKKKKKRKNKTRKKKMRGGAMLNNLSKNNCQIINTDRRIPITMISAHGFEGTDTYKLRENQYVIMSSVPNKRLWLSIEFRNFVIEKFKRMGQGYYGINEIVEKLNKSDLWHIEGLSYGEFKVYCPGEGVSNLNFKFLLSRQELTQKDTFLRGFANMRNYATFQHFNNIVKLNELSNMGGREQVCRLCLDKQYSGHFRKAIKYLNRYKNIKDFFDKNSVGILFLPICREPPGERAGNM